MHTDPLTDTTVVLPPGVTIDRYTVAGPPSDNHLEATPRVHIEPYRDLFHAGPRDDAWMIRKGFPSDRLVWNYTLGDWSYPHDPDPADFSRPLQHAVRQALRIVGLDEPQNHPAPRKDTDVDDRPGITLTREQLEDWAARPLTDEEVELLDECIGNSSIPGAIGEIVDGFHA